MANAAPPFARRAVGFGTVAFVGVMVGVAVGQILPETRSLALVAPTLLTLVLAAVGLVLAALSLLTPLVLRLIPALTLFGIAGVLLTPLGAGPGIALAAAPLAIWASRMGSGARGGSDALSLLLLTVVSGTATVRPELLGFRIAYDLSTSLVVGGLALAGTAIAIVVSGRNGIASARFDLRAALALAALVAIGFLVALATTQWPTLLAARGLAVRSGSWLGMTPFLLFGACWIAAVASGLGRWIGGGRRIVAGLSGLVFALVFATLVPRSIGFLGLFIVPIALGLLTPASYARAQRAHPVLPVAALILAVLLGMPLAGGLVAGFTPRLIAEGTNTPIPLATNWNLVLGFYAALALVILLAHLAHAYEFGVAALDPDDNRDPLPILRKGLSRASKS